MVEYTKDLVREAKYIADINELVVQNFVCYLGNMFCKRKNGKILAVSAKFWLCQQYFSLSDADDITQIITYPGKSKKMLAKRIEKEIKNINEFEHKWKIKTNVQKFNLLPIACKKPEKVNIDGNIIPYAKQAKILGLELQPTGYKKHIQNTKTKSQIALNTIKKFKNLNTSIKLHLAKAVVLPILTYPSYTLNALTNNQILTLQKQQNKALRYVYNERYPYNMNTETLHNTAKVQPINTRIHTLANNTYNKLTNVLKDEQYKNCTQPHDNRDHAWFKRPIKNVTNNPPDPLFT